MKKQTYTIDIPLPEGGIDHRVVVCADVAKATGMTRRNADGKLEESWEVRVNDENGQPAGSLMFWFLVRGATATAVA
ncbi:hypothetical protein HLB44_22845 [Aquincola sp. S2]|uniref:Uncharacterized protein n=1 Tax=Pseudaquabacterium terrae TaxID=2732868 RepID=A0ABX2EMM0_9BURK|nr:hypothetical protein [Aquabacterium terrae]NRF69848.1 hypothetical protein [Aquabacterium terrae]